jgi:putative ABC transport system permease protein
MIVVSVVVWSQMRMIDNLDLGFDRSGMVVVDLPRQDEFNVNTLWPAMASQLQAHNNIQAVTHSLSTPLQGLNLNARVAKSGTGQTSEPLMMRFNPVQPNYFSTYKIAFVSGRGFTQEADVIPSIMQEQNPSISIRGGVILNESAVAALGWSASEAIGNSLTLISERVTATVIGVVKDTVNSARDEAAAMVYGVPEIMEFPFGVGGQASIRISGSDIPGTMAHIQDVWDSFIPDRPIDPQFSEALWNGLYDQENQQRQMFSVSALIAVLVACFGLYGLASFNAERRTKEIGIRKVMGSGVWSIVLLFTNDFSKLVLAANVIAWPIAWYAMNRWLANFAYHIDLTPMIFIGSGLIALCIAWVTVGGTAAKAASQRPVLALRYE